MRPYDGQDDILDAIRALVEHPSLDAETLGRIVLTLDGFVRSELIDRATSDALLAEVAS